jgi:hypothetical protein
MRGVMQIASVALSVSATGVFASGGPEAFFATEVASVRVGSGDAQISDRECFPSEGSCIGGFASIGADDTLFFFDPGRNNVKVIPSGLPRGGLARLIPGPQRGPRMQEWLDGAVGNDGAIYLLEASSRTSRTVILAMRRPGRGSWSASDPIEVALLNTDEDPPTAPDLRAGSTRLAALPTGEIVLCAGRGLLGPALVVASEGSLLAPSLRTRRAPGLVLPRGRRLRMRDGALEFESLDGNKRCGPREAHRLVGADGAGNLYFVVSTSWAEERLQGYDRDCRLVASAAVPERPIWKSITPPGPLYVTRGGDVIEVGLSESRLVVWRWIRRESSAAGNGGRD